MSGRLSGRKALLTLDLANQALGGRSVMEEMGEKGTSVSEQFVRRVDERLGTLSKVLGDQDEELKEERKRVEGRLRELVEGQKKEQEELVALRRAADPLVVEQRLASMGQELGEFASELKRVAALMDSGVEKKLEAMGAQVARVALITSRLDAVERALRRSENAHEVLEEKLDGLAARLEASEKGRAVVEARLKALEKPAPPVETA